jgi:sugar/nucleoside kinase (ribokinase family)
MGVARVLGGSEPATAHAAAERILSHLPPGGVVILKCGHRGAYALSAQATLHVAAPTVTVQDTVGAGDTLAAAFLHAHLQGRDITAALRLAVAAGSLSTRLPGGVDGQPTDAEASDLAATLTATTVPAGSAPAVASTPPVDLNEKMRTTL